MSERPYDIEWVEAGGGVNDHAKVELPFLLREKFEDDYDFEGRAARDFQIIARFMVKFAVKRGCSEAVAKDIAAQLKLHVTKSAAFIRGFIGGFAKELSEPVLDVLYGECIGNLPAQYRDNERLRSSDAAKIQPRRPSPGQQQLDLRPQPRTEKRFSNPVIPDRLIAKPSTKLAAISPPLCTVAPNPENQTLQSDENHVH
jgi:hypothetical protein